jgi:tight adherence protein C
VLGLLAGLLLFVSSDGRYPWALALPVLGFFTPDLLVYNSAQKRQAEIGRNLPDAIDLLNLCVESGLGFEAAMARVSGRGETPVAEEFARFDADLKLGKSRGEALKDMADRNENKQLRRFVAAMRQADRLGIQISQVLAEQAADIREQRRESARAQAQKVTVKILAPVILCFLPATFIVIIGPAALRIIEGIGGAG